jgi:uncharacterized protein YodC (DUF2158 family)
MDKDPPVGSLVRLNCAGPKGVVMVVSSGVSDLPNGLTSESTREVWCRWQTSAGSPRSESYPVKALVPVRGRRNRGP